MNKISITITCVLIYTIVYISFAGSIDSHYWFPLIIIITVSSGLGKTHLWKDGKKSDKVKKIVGIK
ncbi:MAG: hypothetical protein WCQ32_00680 [bacterium]